MRASQLSVMFSAGFGLKHRSHQNSAVEGGPIRALHSLRPGWSPLAATATTTWQAESKAQDDAESNAESWIL